MDLEGTMKYVVSLLMIIGFLNYAYPQPFEQTLDAAIMENFEELQERFFDLGDDVEYVFEFEGMLIDINSLLLVRAYHEQLDNHRVRQSIEQAIDPEKEEYDPQGSYLVRQLFSEFGIENGFYRFAIASAIVQILIFENIFLGKNPELHAYLNSGNAYVAVDELESFLGNVNVLLQSFHPNDINLVRQYIDTIVDNLQFAE